MQYSVCGYVFDTGPASLSCIVKVIRTDFIYNWVTIFLSKTEKSKLKKKNESSKSVISEREVKLGLQIWIVVLLVITPLVRCFTGLLEQHAVLIFCVELGTV
jgi:hypothetical protein